MPSRQVATAVPIAPHTCCMVLRMVEPSAASSRGRPFRAADCADCCISGMPIMNTTCASTKNAGAVVTPMARNSSEPITATTAPHLTSGRAPTLSYMRPVAKEKMAFTTPPASISMPAVEESRPRPRCSSCGARNMSASVQANEQVTISAGTRKASMPRARSSSTGCSMCSWRYA